MNRLKKNFNELHIKDISVILWCISVMQYSEDYVIWDKIINRIK